MILDQEKLQIIAKEVNEPYRKNCRDEDYKRYLMLNGKTAGIIRDAIAKEFSKPETVEELISRLIPINFTGKIITKLAGIYTQSPSRTVKDKSPTDMALLDSYVQYISLDQRMKEANRYFKLFKRNLMEVYLDDKSGPSARNLPRHTYEVFSFSSTSPNRADAVCKILRDSTDPKLQVFSMWSDESHWLTNGTGEPLADRMAQLQNPNGQNPYGALPFVYINESSDSVDPLTDDDLFRMSIALPVMLTDICFALKYQAWSLIYTIGATGDVPSNPNSVFPMDWGPDNQEPKIGQIKPEVDSDKVIALIQTLVALLLSTKNLAVGTIQAKLDTGNVASGISKMIDSAESIEDKKDQQAYFNKAEQDFWTLLSKKMIPQWRKTSAADLPQDLNAQFSDTFGVLVHFQDPKVLISEIDQVELSQLRLEAGFSTLKRELKVLYPQMSDDDIDELVIEIKEEKKQLAEIMANAAPITTGFKKVISGTGGNAGGVEPNV